MIRESIARQTGAPGALGDLIRPVQDVEGGSAVSIQASFARFPLLKSGDEDGACVIEPSVRCNHCGYCLSYGH